MILLFIFLIGCFVMSLVAVGLLFALASVGYADEYKADSAENSGETAEPLRRIKQRDPAQSEPPTVNQSAHPRQQEDL